jgi:C-terminal processing protease CtpA/Prc
MGNGSSQEQADKVGYRVLGVQASSPSAQVGLVSFFDFIVAANDVELRSLDTTLIDMIKEHEDRELQLKVYNCKNNSLRDVVLTPSKKWPGEGMLGVTIRFDTYFEADENLCHVLEVEADSPAELAGLQAGSDYLLGTTEKVFKDTDILFEELKENIDKPVEFYVYNSETDVVRVVVILPNANWGGSGILGAHVAQGYLHVLPSKCLVSTGSSSMNPTPLP